MTNELAGAKLNIREIWKIPWDNQIAESEGETKRLLHVAKNMSDDVRSIAKLKTTPVVVAWLLLWERNFSILSATLGIASQNLIVAGGGSLHTLEIFMRQALELQLDLMVLHDPDAQRLGIEEIDDIPALEDRLCAYLAICCHNESRYFDYLTKNWVLDDIEKSSKPPQSSLEKRLIKELWGDDSMEQQNKSSKPITRNSRRNMALRERNRLQNWLRHDDLAPWANKLRGRNAPRTFRSLVSGNEESFQNRLRQYDMGSAYPIYHRSSGIIHGSTVGPFLQDFGAGLEPAIIGLEANIEKEVGHVRRLAHNNHVRISALRKLALLQ